MSEYAELPNMRVKTEQGLTYSYRDTGGDGIPLVLLQHFRGNLDNWDPALVDALGSGRRVVAFDNVGVAGSDGKPASTIGEMAAGALGFLDALKLQPVDLLGFSIGMPANLIAGPWFISQKMENLVGVDTSST